LFLVSTILTSVTGFLFPVEHLLPSHKVGIIWLVVLAVAIAALYLFYLAGKWRAPCVISALTSTALSRLCSLS
jgi:LPS O-antigen subunit length determinant protein (WzzB/FepE family)